MLGFFLLYHEHTVIELEVSEIICSEAREMAHWLSVYTTLTEDQSLLVNNHKSKLVAASSNSSYSEIQYNT